MLVKLPTYVTACATPLTRPDERGVSAPVDPLLAWFVLALEALGATPRRWMVPHPQGAYIAFDAPVAVARRVANLGYFEVHVGRYEGTPEWTLVLRRYFEPASELELWRFLSHAAEEWQAALAR